MPQRRRIVLLFGLGIVLPSLLLGYLAYRGIQNDQALLEKERLGESRRAADEIVRSVDGEITAVETALTKAVAGRAEPVSPEMRSVLEKLTAEYPLVEGIFVLDARDGARFPVARPLYLPDGRRTAGISPSGRPGPSPDYQTAQRLEFQEKDYRAALAAYRRALGRTTDPLCAGLILNAVARVQKRAGRLEDAVSTYERIVSDYGQVVIAGGMPLGPAAALETCALTRDLREFTRSLRASVGLYRSLLRREWELEKAEFDLFVEGAEGQITALLSGPSPGLDAAAAQSELQALRDELAGSRRRTERMIVFERYAPPALEARLQTADDVAAANPLFSRSSLNIGNASFLVSIQKLAARTGGPMNAAWGIVLDAERLRADVLGPALRDHFPSAETAWAVRDRDGAALLSSAKVPQGPATVRTNFASNFPDWTLDVHQPPPHLVKTFLMSRRGLYSFVFLLIAGILVFGLALTLRSVSHELALARMKSDFVSTVSHEFKSPLTSIRQLAEMLQSGRVPSEERRQQYYDVLLEQSERLALLTDNILGLAKIEEGRAEFVFERTDLGALLKDVVSALQDRVRHEGFEIRLTVGEEVPPLAADRRALAQAVTNLIDNAVKYSGESRQIAVDARVEENGVAIAVRDFGIGIKKEDLDRVFGRFYRGGDELTRSVKGSGLGLALVKVMVEAHRGKIQVESEPGKGSVFTIRLPLPHREGS
jgi:signal transduction histidine kinase